MALSLHPRKNILKTASAECTCAGSVMPSGNVDLFSALLVAEN